MKSIRNLFFILTLAVLFTSCNKVSLSGVLLGNTSVEDRVKMSLVYLENTQDIDRYLRFEIAEGPDYSFLVGSDSHMQGDSARMKEMFDICMKDGDLFCTHLGDIADTQPEYYVQLKNLLDDYKEKWYREKKGWELDEKTGIWYKKNEAGEKEIVSADESQNMRFPLYATVGNHDITHNGWTLFADIFKTSFYEVYVNIAVESTEDNLVFDRFIFIDSANGTLGPTQTEYILENTLLNELEKKLHIRNTFAFTHNNIFRPSESQFASTYPREELYFLLDFFTDNYVNTVFMGHVHAWDERDYSGVHYVTLDAMSEDNNPEAGDYLVRTRVYGANQVKIERVRMNYVNEKKAKKK